MFSNSKSYDPSVAFVELAHTNKSRHLYLCELKTTTYTTAGTVTSVAHFGLAVVLIEAQHTGHRSTALLGLVG